MAASLLGGGLAGSVFFLVAYPFDYMKTLFQTDNLEKPKYKNLYDCLTQRIKAGGIAIIKQPIPPRKERVCATWGDLLANTL